MAMFQHKSQWLACLFLSSTMCEMVIFFRPILSTRQVTAACVVPGRLRAGSLQRQRSVRRLLRQTYRSAERRGGHRSPSLWRLCDRMKLLTDDDARSACRVVAVTLSQQTTKQRPSIHLLARLLQNYGCSQHTVRLRHVPDASCLYSVSIHQMASPECGSAHLIW